MNSRTIRVIKLHEAGLSYRNIAKTLNMSLRDVTKAVQNGNGKCVTTVTPEPIASNTESVTAALPIASVTVLPEALPQAVTNDELSRTLRRLKWAMDDSEKVLQEMSVMPHQITNVLGPLRTIANDLCKQYPVAKDTAAEVTPVSSGPWLANDPLASSL
ncbi:hypothetical protein P0D88_00960 [Paraburkholderia sp. RL18-103-BIB-C]|uniref:hypothetical protein n=1 Tax=Paraburkholderia sp. RL18-103-BIB-C TaxID=3031637 RepID=UPI0038BC0408